MLAPKSYLLLSVIKKTTKLAAKKAKPNNMFAEYENELPLKTRLASVLISASAD